jgi:hypothetical protein
MMGRIAYLFPAGRRRINEKIILYMALFDHMGQDALCHGAAADVAVADK